MTKLNAERHRAGLILLIAAACVSGPARGGADCRNLEEVERLLAPNGGGLRLTDVVAIGPNDVWAVGYQWTASERFALTAHYDGAGWTIVPSPSPGSAGLVSAGLNAVAALASDDVWAAGDYERDGGPYKDTLVLRWDGSAWEAVPSPGVSDFGEQGFSFAAVEALGADDIWFTGTRGNRALGAFTAHWDGSGFTVHSTPSVGNRAHEIVGVSAIGPADVWGVGGIATILSGGFVMRWDGAQWSTVLAPDLNSPRRYFYDVAALAPDDVWVAGLEYFVDDNNVYRPRPYFIHGDGSTWTEAAAPAFARKLKAFSPDDVYGISGRTLVHWDGAAWTTIDSVAPEGALNNLVSIDGADACNLHLIGQVEDASNELAGWIVTAVGEIAGDLDGDGDVDLTDLSLLLAAFGSCSGDANYDPAADLDGSGCVELVDLSTLLAAFGT